MLRSYAINKYAIKNNDTVPAGEKELKNLLDMINNSKAVVPNT